MNIGQFMVGYRTAWEQRDTVLFSSTGSACIDGVAQARFARGLCADARIWWHSMPPPA
jgi:hypothetical protein